MNETFVPAIKPISTSKSAEFDIRRAKKLLSEKRFEDALTILEKIVDRDQANSFVHMAIGRIKAKLKDYNGALLHFNRAIEIDPTQLRPYLRSARVCIQTDDLLKAEELFSSALKINSRSAIAFAGIGLVQAKTNRLNQAIESWSKSLEFNPRIVAVRKQIAKALHAIGRTQDAIGQINAAARIKPDDPDVFSIKGRLHLLDKNYELAQQAYETAIDLDKEEKRQNIKLGLTEAYINDGKVNQAERVLSSVPQREQFSSLVHKLWGDIYTAKGMHKEALEEYRSASLTDEVHIGIVDFDEIDILSDDLEEEKWEELASYARDAATGVIEKKRASTGLNPKGKIRLSDA